MTWTTFGCDELWSADDEYSIMHSPNGYWCMNWQTYESSPVYQDRDDAKRWAEEHHTAELARQPGKSECISPLVVDG